MVVYYDEISRINDIHTSVFITYIEYFQRLTNLTNESSQNVSFIVVCVVFSLALGRTCQLPYQIAVHKAHNAILTRKQHVKMEIPENTHAYIYLMQMYLLELRIILWVCTE